MSRRTEPLPFPEFVVMLALMVSIVAMATDIVLPALGVIARDLGVDQRNDAQLVVSSLFAGFGVGQLLAGPISDTIGRKRTIYLGYGVFVVGALLSVYADDLSMMLAGRVLQGLGAAPARIVSMALVRDTYSGRAMARVMSVVMAVFIIVPAVSPAVGQLVIEIGTWHDAFWLLIGLAVTCFLWFGLRQPETLPADKRRPFSFKAIRDGVREALAMPQVGGYILCAGCVFGAFLGYLSSAQQVFQVAYDKGALFPIYFGVVALALGAASITNSRIVMRLGMRYITRRALIAMASLSLAFLVPVLLTDGLPPFWAFLTWLMAAFFCVGMLFGNLNAMAMEPLGHMAGLGAALVGAGMTLISLPLGWTVGRLFDGGVTPLVGGYAVLGSIALGVMLVTERRLGRETP